MKWLQSHWLAVASLFFSGLYLYLQLLQWQRHGDDLMPAALSIVVTVMLWAFLAGAIARYARTSKTNQASPSEIEGLRRQILDEVGAKMDREGRFQELKRHYEETKEDLRKVGAELLECRAKLSIAESAKPAAPASVPSNLTHPDLASIQRLLLAYKGAHDEGWVLLQGLGGCWRFDLLHFMNTSDTDIPVTANNVRGRIEYVHADKERIEVRLSGGLLARDSSLLLRPI